MNAKLLNNLALVETSDGSATLFSTEYQQTYHSKHGALNECEHIYLHASGVFERLQAGKITRLLEVGFGTGLNFLVTAALARKSCTALQYWAIEKNWVPEKQFAELNYGRHFPKLHDVWSAFSTMQPALLQENIARFHFEPNIELTILFGDATILDIPLKNFHAVYHDAFSPEANPELWTADFFQKIKESCEEGAVLSTYSSKKSVQQALREAGFVVQKVPGPWGKRDILRARVEQDLDLVQAHI